MTREKCGYVYILFSKPYGTLYTGVTSDLVRWVYEHKSKVVEGFTSKYGVDRLGYYEVCGDILTAIAREKQIKAGSRAKKIALIEGMNPICEIYTRQLCNGNLDCFVERTSSQWRITGCPGG